MHAVLSSLTAAVLFIHTVFGCCWHHAHSGLPRVAAGQPAKCCEHHQHRDEGQQSGTPGSCDEDCEGACAYVLAQRVQIEAPQFVFLLDLDATLSLLADAQIVSASASDVGDCSRGAAPPVGLYLLHHALLS